jgi:hypothetical protein
MIVWVFVLGAFHALCFLVSILYLLAAILRYETIRKVKPACDFILVTILFNFWIAWMIWGNIIIYKQANQCKNVQGADVVHRLMLAFVVIGYLGFLVYGCLALGTMCALIGRNVHRYGRRKAYDAGLFSYMGYGPSN